MQTWEYSTVQSSKDGIGFQWSSGASAVLNEMGQKGWELVSVVETQRNLVEWVFKRPQLRTAPLETESAQWLAS